MQNSRILEHIRVVELASVLAGPSVGLFLAELGATVVKVENPLTGGDVTRHWKTAEENPEAPVSAYYSSVNWGKEVLSADLTQSGDLEKVKALIREADIVLTNFKPGDDRKFGLTIAEMRALKSNLIIGEISGFPEGDRPAFDIVLQAETGFMSLNGTPESGPLKWPLPVVDILASHQLKEGILLALYQRERTGKGAHVHVSLFDAAVASLYNIGTNVLMGNQDPQATGPLHANIAPYGETITTSDQVTLVLAVGTDRQFAHLAELLGASPEFLAEFSTNISRVKNRQKLGNELKRLAAQQTFDGLNAGLIWSKIPFGRIRTVKSVIEELPSEYFLTEETEGLNTSRMRTAIFTIRI
jgi:crotonobetainyl-CoA:carnitine CoA-transferase CaiB-like acyl-CoA transferase